MMFSLPESFLLLRDLMPRRCRFPGWKSPLLVRRHATGTWLG
jgi:hypothetical protein